MFLNNRFLKILFIPVKRKQIFLQPLLQLSVSHDPSEILAALEIFLIINIVGNGNHHQHHSKNYTQVVIPIFFRIYKNPVISKQLM